MGQILEMQSLKDRWEFPHLVTLPAIVIHIHISYTETTLPSLAMVL